MGNGITRRKFIDNTARGMAGGGIALALTGIAQSQNKGDDFEKKYPDLPLHDNTRHGFRYIHTYTMSQARNSLDIIVDGNTDVTLLSVSPGTVVGQEEWVIPFNCVVQCRLNTAPANDLVDVWWDVDGVQRSLKYQITIRDAVKMSFPIPMDLTTAHNTFWTQVTSVARVYNLKARRQTIDANQVIFSNRALNVMRIQRDIT